MPRKPLMSWTLAKWRWRKRYLGRYYTVYCSDLDLPKEQWTELGSYQVANEWWIAKRAEIDGRQGKRVLPDEAEAVLQKLQQKKAYSEKEGFTRDASVYAAAIEEAEQQIAAGDYDLTDLDPLASSRRELLELFGGHLPPDIGPDALEAIFGVDELWNDRRRRESVVAVSKRIGTHLDAWYELVHRRAKPSSITNIHGYYQEFKAIRADKALVLGEDMAVEVIDEAKFAEVFRAIDGQDVGEGTKKKKWAYFKQFVNHLSENKLIPLPTNFRSKLLVFSTSTSSKEAPDVAAIRAFLKTLPDRLKLYALLALNCGMNNVDIGKLRPNQIDWSKRTLTRKRIKTEAKPKVPMVTYRLWAETTRLLLQEGSKRTEFVLTADDGTCLYVDDKVGNKAKLYDRIKTQWRDHFKRGQRSPYTLMQFRFFGADLLRSSGEFRSYRDPFLGHSPKSVADRNYSANEDVSAACVYLEGIFYPTDESKKPS